ncbi:MAG TPA: DUF2254 family protein [Gaiellaceae bacterium]
MERASTHGDCAVTTQRRKLLWRAVKLYAVIPTAVIASFVVLAALSIVADEASWGPVESLRKAVSDVIGAQAATTTLQAVAGGLVTVTSITFSVLLLAVQQTASSLSPVVFNQWVRRRTNQVFLGFFVGLALYAFVVLVFVRRSTPPVLGASIATGLTVVALLFLVVLVYATIEQMRPSSVTKLIRDRTLLAREREAALVSRTRRVAESGFDAVAGGHVETMGHINEIDLNLIARALERLPEGEVRLYVSLGDFAVFGQRLFDVLDGDETAAREVAAEVCDAFVISPHRDLDADATTGIDELANIAWTNGSTSRHNPQVARTALNQLEDIAMHWLLADPCAEAAPDLLRIVYPDNDLDRLLDTFYSLVLVSQESHQHVLARDVLEAYARMLERADGATLERLLRDLDVADGVLDRMPPSPMLDEARHRLDSARERALVG